MEEYLLRIAEQYKLKEKQDSKLKSIKLNGMTLVVNGLYLHTMLKLVKESFKSKLLLACQGGLVHPIHFDAKGLENFRVTTCIQLLGTILLILKAKSCCYWYGCSKHSNCSCVTQQP